MLHSCKINHPFSIKLRPELMKLFYLLIIMKGWILIFQSQNMEMGSFPQAIVFQVRTKQSGCHRRRGDVGWPTGDLGKIYEPGDSKDYLWFVLFLRKVLCMRNKLVPSTKVVGDRASASSGISSIQVMIDVAQKLLEYGIHPQGRMLPSIVIVSLEVVV